MSAGRAEGETVVPLPRDPAKASLGSGAGAEAVRSRVSLRRRPRDANGLPRGSVALPRVTTGSAREGVLDWERAVWRPAAQTGERS